MNDKIFTSNGINETLISSNTYKMLVKNPPNLNPALNAVRNKSNKRMSYLYIWKMKIHVYEVIMVHVYAISRKKFLEYSGTSTSMYMYR